MFVYPFISIMENQGLLSCLHSEKMIAIPKIVGMIYFLVFHDTETQQEQQRLRNASLVLTVQVWVHCIILWQNMLAALKELS